MCSSDPHFDINPYQNAKGGGTRASAVQIWKSRRCETLKGCKFYVQNRTKKASNQKRRVVPPLPFAIFDQEEEEEEEEEEEARASIFF